VDSDCGSRQRERHAAQAEHQPNENHLHNQNCGYFGDMITISPNARALAALGHDARLSISIPAAMAVWALARPHVCTLYIGLSLTGAFASGLLIRLWTLA
jgi:hypothetical protein